MNTTQYTSQQIKPQPIGRNNHLVTSKNQGTSCATLVIWAMFLALVVGIIAAIVIHL